MKVSSSGSQDAASFIDILVPVLTGVGVIFFCSLWYASSLSSQVDAEEEQVRSLTEKVGTLHEQLRDQEAANQLETIETSVPHPDTQDRDAQAIGDHINVAWSYPNDYSGKYVNFELELINLNCNVSDSTQRKCKRLSRYITSDGASRSSRIPTGSGRLEAGFYAWRVAPVPADTVIKEDMEDEVNPLSNWSNFGSFTLYPSLLDRIDATNVIRVGTNLEQDTRFSRRTRDGNILGFDISLIYTLIEKCLEPRDSLHPLRFNHGNCDDYINNLPQGDLMSRPNLCSPEKQLCVKLVPIQKWGDWQSALRRKEIDLFIGSVTATDSRQRDGVLFTPGYLKFKSQLYGHATDFVNGGSDLSSWLKSKRLVGVIEKSTNENLLDELCKEFNGRDCREGVLQKQTFTAFPPMEHAMDLGEIDGVLIDETFVEHTDWHVVSGMRGRHAWNNYIKNYIGEARGVEEVAIAVAVDDVEPPPGQLYRALRDGLAPDSPIIQRYIPRLCGAYWEHSPLATFCGIEKGL